MKFKNLIPGNSLSMLCLDPITYEVTNIIGCIVESINYSGTVLGVRFTDQEDKNRMMVVYFKVNPDLEINDSLKEDKEHRLKALFESKKDAITGYIEYCEAKIKTYEQNIQRLKDW